MTRSAVICRGISLEDECMPENLFGNPLIRYIVQLEMEMVKLNKMRTPRAVDTISRGVRYSTNRARKGWSNRISQPSLRDLVGRHFHPAVNCRAIFNRSFGTKSAIRRSENFWGRLIVPMLACVLTLFTQRILAIDTNTTQGYLEIEFQKWHQQFQTNSNSAEVAWNFGRACFDMSTLQKDPSAEARYAQEGIDATQAALTLAPNSAPAHYYLGMDLGQLADTKRNFSAFKMVKDMEREFSAAHALDKHFDFGGPSRNLGLLYRDAPTIISIGSRTKARQYLEEAVELAPEFPENQLNLIESYLKWDYKTEAVRQFGDLEKRWAPAQKQFTGVAWQASWTDWNKRTDAIRKKLEKSPKTEAPHSQ